MAEIVNENIEVTEMGAADYIALVKDYRENYVPKSVHNKALADNRMLAQALANGEFCGSKETNVPVKPSVEEAKKKVFTGRKKTDLQYFSEVLDLRDAVLASGGRDPFLHTDPDYVPTEQDKITAERVADNLREAIEYAEGDPALFRQEMQRRGCKPIK